MMQSEETLVKIETAFEDAKAKRFQKNLEYKAARAKLHTQLVAKRNAGDVLTIADMRAIEDLSINDNIEVRTAYLAFIEADGEYRKAKVAWESAKRMYWDSKPQRV